MGLEFDGVLEYIYAEELSAEELWKSLVPRMSKRAGKGMWAMH